MHTDAKTHATHTRTHVRARARTHTHTVVQVCSAHSSLSLLRRLTVTLQFEGACVVRTQSFTVRYVPLTRKFPIG